MIESAQLKITALFGRLPVQSNLKVNAMIITQNYMSCTPAYGRDYKSAKAAKSDFLDGKDFILNSVELGFTYCSVSDFKPGVKVKLHYNQERMITVVQVPKLIDQNT